MIKVVTVNEDNTIDLIYKKMIHENIAFVESKIDREAMGEDGYIRCVDRDGIERYVDAGDLWN